MSLINTPPIVKRDDWNSAVEFSKKTRQVLQQLAHLRLGYDSTPTFENVTIDGLTATRLVQTDANKKLTSVSDLTSWVAGAANEIDIADDGDGTVTIGIVNPLIVAKGGIGTDTLTNHSLLLGSTAAAVRALGVAANGQLPIGSADVDPVLATLTETAKRVLVENAAGSITLSTPQDIDTDSYPVFINTNTALSPMIMTGGAISAGTNAGTIKVAELTAMLRTTDSVTGTLTRITLAEQDNIALAAEETFYYVVLTYGDPCTIATSATAPAGTNAISIGRCLKEADGTRHFASSGLRLNDGVNKLHTRATHLRHTEKDSGGGLIASTGTRNFSITAAHFHRGANVFDFAQKDTSVTDVFDYYYYNPTSGEWVKDDNTGSHYAALDNVQYNNVDAGTGLANLTANKYTTNWIFVHPDDGHIVVVYGRSNGTLTTAQNEDIPASLPDVVEDMGILLAKVIIQEGSNTLIIQNVEYFAFSPNITVDHNELSGLQGGTADEYYHMTAAEHTLGAAIMALIPTDGNFIVGNGTTWVTESGATARTSLGLGTGDSPTFTALSLGTGELTCGSINRAADTLTIEINGTPQISITSTTVTYAGDVVITGTATYSSNIIIPDDGWIGSVTTNQAIQIASTGNITMPGTLNITGDLAVTGNISLTVNNGSVGYTDNSPMLVFNNTDDRVELTGAAGLAFTSATGVITQNTADGSDNAVIQFCGGGVVGNSRGGYCNLFGNEHATAPGCVEFVAGNVTGGHVKFYTGNNFERVRIDKDGLITFYGNLVIPDAGYIGSATATTAIQVANDAAVTLVGTITASNYTAANLLTACATSAGGLDFSSAVTLTVAETETTTNYHTDARAATWLAANHETTYTHTDIALNTTHRGSDGSDHTHIDQAVTIASSPTFAGLTLSGTLAVEGASVTVGKASTTTGTLVLHDSNSANTITITVPNITAGSLSFTLPPTDGDDTNVLQTDGNGVLTWVAAGGGGVGNHAMLDGTVHTDSVADDVSRGSLIYGNATPKWDELGLGLANTFLGSDGTDISYRTAAQVMASLSGAGLAAFDLNGQDLTNGGVLFLTEQADDEADVAGKGQFWVKDDAPNTAMFTDDAGNKHPLRMSAITETINLLAADNTAAKQAKIDAVHRYIPPGVTVTFQFETSQTHTETAGLEWIGFWGGGSLIVQGDLGEANWNQLHTTQNTILDFTTNNVNGLDFVGISLPIIWCRVLKVMIQDGANRRGIRVRRCTGYQYIDYNYVLGAGFTNATYGIISSISVFTRFQKNYVSNVRYGLRCEGGIALALNNDDTGTKPDYGLRADSAATLGKSGTVPTGNTSDESVDSGGVIRA